MTFDLVDPVDKAKAGEAEFFGEQSAGLPGSPVRRLATHENQIDRIESANPRGKGSSDQEWVRIRPCGVLDPNSLIGSQCERFA
jgi:hypothetical protein